MAKRKTQFDYSMDGLSIHELTRESRFRSSINIEQPFPTAGLNSKNLFVESFVNHNCEDITTIGRLPYFLSAGIGFRNFTSSEFCMSVVRYWVLLAASSLMFVGGSVAADPISIEIDARELPRRLLHTTLDIPCKPGELRLWYPKWIPGTHGPKGRVEDLAGLKVETPDGVVIPWKRHEIDLHSFLVQVPAGVTSIRVKMDTICEASSVESAGIYTYANSSIGTINWNTCVLYPDVTQADQQQVSVRLRLPAEWKYATALKAGPVADGVIPFKTVTLETFIDSPLITGKHLKSYKLNNSGPPVYLDVTSESLQAILLDTKVLEQYSKMVREAEALFGVTHYSEYHLLVVCSDEFGRFGVEHLESSMNGVGERALVDDNLRKGWIAMLLPHEYAHSWCGKYRRPATMITNDYHTPMKTKLLWVYEGLDTYLGEVLMVRAGLATPEEYRVSLARTIRGLNNTTGRQWRPLEDTAVASHLSRAPGKSWNQWRRTQDYYQEGMMLWYEVDTIIREKSNGAKSLDDFCKLFFRKVPGKATVAGHDFDDVVKDLKSLVDYDWETLLTRRVTLPQEALPLEVVSRLGYRLQYAGKPAQLTPPDPDNPAADSLGLTIAAGVVTGVVPEMPGDKAGLSPGMKVIAVNGKKFSANRLRDAIADTVMKKKLDFLIEDGDEFRTVSVSYEGGLRYLELSRVEGKPDVLSEIIKSRTK